MATREHRLAEFNGGLPPSGLALQLLCEDHNGTYVLPYLCRWQADAWRNSASGEVIEATVVGWRAPPPPRSKPV